MRFATSTMPSLVLRPVRQQSDQSRLPASRSSTLAWRMVSCAATKSAAISRTTRERVVLGLTNGRTMVPVLSNPRCAVYVTLLAGSTSMKAYQTLEATCLFLHNALIEHGNSTMRVRSAAPDGPGWRPANWVRSAKFTFAASRASELGSFCNIHVRRLAGLRIGFVLQNSRSPPCRPGIGFVLQNAILLDYARPKASGSRMDAATYITQNAYISTVRRNSVLPLCCCATP